MKHSRKVATTIVRLSCVLVLLGGFLSLPPMSARAATPFVVTTNVDAPDSNPGDGSCYNTVAEGCSLRAALREAFTASKPVNITFSASLANTTIVLSLGMLDWAASDTHLYGETNNVTISGAGLSSGSLLRISGSDNTMANVSFTKSPGDAIQVGDYSGTGEGNNNSLQYLYVYGNAGNGITLHGGSYGGGHTNRITGSTIGANSTSNLCPTVVNNGLNGILIEAGADSSWLEQNKIVCSGHSGIMIAFGGSNSTTITDNKLGTDGSNYAVGNGWDGITDSQGTNTWIQNNLISGNSSYGIWLSGSSGAILYQNKIGTNEAGTAALPNQLHGIYISEGATNNQIGSPTYANYGNIISGNYWNGVFLSGGANNNALDGNYIGLGANGRTAIPNGFAGVASDNAWNNTLSSTGSGVLPQFISGNNLQGVYATNTSGLTINNATHIGVAADMSTAVGNAFEGVKLDISTYDSIIHPGTVMHNGGAGIAVLGDTSTGNHIVPGTVGLNGGIGIDLGDDGQTLNGSYTPPGPNNWINHPTATGLTATGFTGHTCSNCLVYFYRAIGDPLLNQGGGSYLSMQSADASGNFQYVFPRGVQSVTMNTCDSYWNCSEMSPMTMNSHSYIYMPMIKR